MNQVVVGIVRSYADSRLHDYSPSDLKEINLIVARYVVEAERIENNWYNTPSFERAMSDLEKRLALKLAQASKKRNAL